MEKYLLGLWRDPDVEFDAFQSWLVDECAPTLGSDRDVLGLALRQTLAEQMSGADGRSNDSLDALLSVWAEKPPRSLLAAASRARRREVWRVAEHRQKVYAEAPPEGSRTPGLGMVALMRAAPDTTREACQRYWVEHHAGLALRVHQGLSGYVQNVVLETLTPGGEDVIGVAELQFASREDYRDRFYVPPEASQEIFADVPRFMSLDTSESVDTSELVLRRVQE
jgi:uncharacterized protein (TIGR02118 family)